MGADHTRPFYPILSCQVLHQPRYEIYAQFDDLLLLGKGGFTAFTGETPLAVPYFEKLGFKKDPNTNPADFVMDALCGMGDGPETDFEGVFPCFGVCVCVVVCLFVVCLILFVCLIFN